MEIRENLIQTVLKNFLHDLSESSKLLSGSNETIYFIDTLTEYLRGIYNRIPPNEYFDTVDFDEEDFLHEKLYLKFREKMVPFVKCSLQHYFAKDEFNQAQLFKKLKLESEIFTYVEYEDYIVRLFSVLRIIRRNLALQPEAINTEQTDIKTAIESSSEESQTENINPRSKEFTRSRQVLLYYFVLKSMGINPRYDTSLASLTRFAHALSGWAYTNADNAPLSSFIKKMPYMKRDKELLKDLEWCKIQFEDIGHTEGIALIQKEIDSIKKK